MNKNKLELLKDEYAKLIIYKGLNDLKDKIFLIRADLDQPEFVNKLVYYAYKRGAKRVMVDWTYRPERVQFYNNISKKEAGTIYDYEIEKYKFIEKEEVRTLRLESEDPFWSEHTNKDNVSLYNKIHVKTRKSFVKKGEKETPWCIASCPSVSWAKRLFPKLSDDAAVNKLWEVIFKCCRVEEGKTLKNWDDYNKFIFEKYKYLNSLNIKELHYKSSNGTDLIVGLNPNAHYTGGAHNYPGKSQFNPNIPANECFVSPDKNNINGVIYSSKPLCRNGILIEDFYFVIKKGKIVEVHAKKNEKYLKELINHDENSCYFGEASLVPFDSFINKTGITFYVTIFDENACCHFAFGDSLINSYNMPIRSKSKEELDKMGLNQSSIHVDFMVGTKDLSIIATTRDNKKITIFKNGVYAK